MIPFLLLACDYSPSGSHYEELSTTPAVLADITLNDYDDTIRLRGNVLLHFQVSLPGRHLYGHQLKLNNTLLTEGAAANGNFYLQTNSYKDGYYTLQLSAIGNSGTGSLADKHGAEAIEVYRTWVVQIENSPPQPVVITAVRPDNGQLRVEWQPYKGAGFEHYLVVRKSATNQYSEHRTIITDPGHTFWLDDNYVGGPVTYTVTVSLNGLWGGVNSKEVPYHSPRPTIRTSSYTTANELTVHISATPFYNNFQSYLLYMNNDQVAEQNDWRDTIITIPAPAFGDAMQASLYVIPKHMGQTSSDYILSPTVATISANGTPWGPHEVSTLLRRPLANRFYALEHDVFKVIDATTLRVLQERNVQYEQVAGGQQNAISEDGRYFYAVLNNVVHQLDPATLQTRAAYEVKDLLPGNHYFNVRLGGCSNSNRLLVYGRNSLSPRDSAFVLNMDLKQVVTKKVTYSYALPNSLSPEGKLLRLDGKLYAEQSNHTWQQLSLTEMEVQSMKYHPTKPLFFISNRKYEYTVSERRILFYSSTNGAPKHTLTTEEELTDCEIDPGSGYLYGFHYDTLYVYDIDSGELIRKQKLTVGTDVFVSKDRIFSKSHYISL